MSKYYIARDKNGELAAYLEKPVKEGNQWVCANRDEDSDKKFYIMDDRLFPEIKWEDEEPKVLTIEE